MKGQFSRGRIRFNLPRRLIERKDATYIRAASKENITKQKLIDRFMHILSEDGVMSIAQLPDNFFISLLSKVAGQIIFSKGAVYRMLGDKVSRPESQLIKIQPIARFTLEKRRQKNQRPADDIVGLLKKGPIFLKPVDNRGSKGEGILRIENRGNFLNISWSYDAAKSILSRLKYERIDYTRKTQNSIDIILGEHNGLPKLIGLVIEQLQGGRYIAEREINMPLFDGKKWEIRHIVQSPNGRSEITGSFAKVGKSDSIVANIAAGGSGASTKSVIKSVYRSIYSSISASELERLADEFIEKANKLSLKSVELLNNNLKDVGKRYISGFPEDELYIRQIAVDIAGVYNEGTKKLEPVIVEVQYPGFGYSELEKIDVEMSRRVTENFAKMARDGKKLLRQAFGLN